ncbi:MAG: 30S ribosomal protein S4 [Bacteroidia bacterium]|nr:30S ribosomal protein S4 [Bacteroidia bacterium]
MARYRGPKTKIARRFKEAIFGPDASLEKRKYGPGQHGRNRRRKQSEYSTQLQEKQKAKYTYGILERQFRKTFDEAARRQGVTGEIFLQLLESRLDNTVFRMGFSPSRSAARQVVGHKHVMVNGVVTNIPSMLLKPGDVITIRENCRSMELINRELGRSKRFSWVDVNPGQYQGTFLNYPNRDEIPENIKEQLIVELYSK